MLGAVTLLLDHNFFDTKCPLAPIRQDLVMYVIPSLGAGDAPSPSLQPGDSMYSVNGKTGTPPASLHPYTILLTGAEDLVISLGQERKMPDSCGGSRYMETSHSHVLATLDQGKDQDVELLQIDLDLLEATSEHSAKVDLLSYLMQLSVASLNSQFAQETCLGSAPAMAGLLEKASMETTDAVNRFIPGGEMIYRVHCPKRRFGVDWLNPLSFCPSEQCLDLANLWEINCICSHRQDTLHAIRVYRNARISQQLFWAMTTSITSGKEGNFKYSAPSPRRS